MVVDKGDGVDVVKGLWYSVKGLWAGDLDLNNGRVQKYSENYENA